MKLLSRFERLLYVGEKPQANQASISVGSLTMNPGGKNASGLAELYALHAQSFGRLAYLLTGDSHIAEDLVIEAFVRSTGHFWKLRDPRAKESYLRRTVINLARSHVRRRRTEERSNLLSHAQQDHVTLPQESDVIQNRKLIEALQRLPIRYKAAIVLRYYEELSEHEVADLLDIPLGTVKTFLHRGKKRLRLEMGDQE